MHCGVRTIYHFRLQKLAKNEANYADVLAKFEASNVKAEKEKSEKEEKLERRIREIQEYFGYWIDPKDPRFEVMLAQKEAEEKKVLFRFPFRGRGCLTLFVLRFFLCPGSCKKFTFKRLKPVFVLSGLYLQDLSLCSPCLLESLLIKETSMEYISAFLSSSWFSFNS